jgi:hypothetical protein
MANWSCGICDREHDALPMDIAWNRPKHFFEVPEEEREERVWFDADSNADLCVIDGATFLIRGVLPLPIDDGSGNFRFGVWVLVEKSSFQTYLEYRGEGADSPSFSGLLSAKVPGYPSTYLLEADVQLKGSAERPRIWLRPSSHPLVLEQQQGITQHRVHEIVQTVFPELFGHP